MISIRGVKSVLWRAVAVAMRSLPQYIYTKILGLPVSTTVLTQVATNATIDQVSSLGTECEPNNAETVDSEHHPAFLNDCIRPPKRQLWTEELLKASIISGKYIVTRDGQFVCDVVEGARKKRVVSRIIEDLAPKSVFRTRRIEGTVGMLGTRWGESYFHWLTDVLPRVKLIRENYGSVGNIDRFIFPAGVPPAGIQALQLLGIERSRHMPLQPGERVIADKIVLPSLPGETGRTPTWALLHLRRSILGKVSTEEGKFPTRLYVARRQSRTVKNRSDLTKILRRHGFVTVYPEDYTFREQVSMFANAEAILGPHGGGLANIIFCKPQVCVLELFSAKYVNPCYSRIAYRLDMDYCYATDDVPAHANYRAGTPYTEEDLSVRPEKVREWLQRL